MACSVSGRSSWRFVNVSVNIFVANHVCTKSPQMYSQWLYELAKRKKKSHHHREVEVSSYLLNDQHKHIQDSYEKSRSRRELEKRSILPAVCFKTTMCESKSRTTVLLFVIYRMNRRSQIIYSVFLKNSYDDGCYTFLFLFLFSFSVLLPSGDAYSPTVAQHARTRTINT